MRKLKYTVREKLSIGQQFMADYLGISRSLLSLYEHGLRDLSSASRTKLNNLENIFHKTDQQKKGFSNAHLQHPLIVRKNKKVKKEMLDNIETCAYKKKTLQRAFDKMLKEHSSTLSLLAVLEELQTTNSKNKEGSFEEKWIAYQQDIALAKMERSGEAAQTMLLAKMEALDAEAAIYKRLQKKI